MAASGLVKTHGRDRNLGSGTEGRAGDAAHEVLEFASASRSGSTIPDVVWVAFRQMAFCKTYRLLKVDTSFISQTRAASYQVEAASWRATDRFERLPSSHADQTDRRTRGPAQVVEGLLRLPWQVGDIASIRAP